MLKKFIIKSKISLITITRIFNIKYVDEINFKFRIFEIVKIEIIIEVFIFIFEKRVLIFVINFFKIVIKALFEFIEKYLISLLK